MALRKIDFLFRIRLVSSLGLFTDRRCGVHEVSLTAYVSEITPRARFVDMKTAETGVK